MLHSPSMIRVTPSVFSQLADSSLLAWRSFAKYCHLQPSLIGTCSLLIAYCTCHGWDNRGSRLVSLSIFRTFLPVGDLAHLIIMLATILTSGLLLLCNLFKKFTYLLTSCCFTVGISGESKLSTRYVRVDLGTSQVI